MTARRQLKQQLSSRKTTATQRRQLNQAIVDGLFATSPYLVEDNFRSIHPDDIQLLYELYDENYFGGVLHKALSPSKISFRLSRRMTRAGGTTTRYGAPSAMRPPRFEIAISTTLLFQSFGDPERLITVTGLECGSRLEGLMRIMEHELVHLTEMLVWLDSSCSRRRFQDIASRIFGHTEHCHDLITPTEAASTHFGIRPGSRVQFLHEGHRLEGIVNRITRRATVLVAHPAGRTYSDGHNYLKFYVPVSQLETVE